MKIYLLHNKLDDTYMNSKYGLIREWEPLCSNNLQVFRENTINKKKSRESVWYNLRDRILFLCYDIVEDMTYKQRTNLSHSPKSLSAFQDSKLTKYLRQEMHMLFNGDFLKFYNIFQTSNQTWYDWNHALDNTLLTMAIGEFEVISIDINNYQKKVFSIYSFSAKKMSKLIKKYNTLKAAGLQPIV